ncbi:MAG: DNA primase [Candidatus Buchananbacteria bacterium RIFCSPHIGHO2_01_FULL_40_35]|nr:MAG: DNA primase [Candidatus Buchananbacteria bacterium RIFCSPHIGHO2_01_FULL_40_35]
MSDIEEIKDRIDITDLMSEYIKLMPAGVNFKALCPFHNEKTPSLIISREKKIFKCFGCGAGGDIFAFLMKIEGLEFPEAKKVLAQKAGVALSHYDHQGSGQKVRLLKAMELAKKYYHHVLLNSQAAQPARDYLTSRGLSEETISDWQLGYSPDDWSSLYDFLKKRGLTDEEIFLAGLTIRKKTGSGFYDRFRGRLMFPINNVSGETVAFTARVSPQNEATETMGKYINSPQTELYDKSRVVFAFNKAKADIKAKDSVVIVEGQMDAITAHQNGFKNVIASSGTALTLEQFQLLKRYTNNFLFAFDLDLAGQNATAKGDALAKALDLYVVESADERGRKHSYIDANLSYNISVKVVEISGAKDPDEMIRRNPLAWQQAVKNAKPIMEYYFDLALKGLNQADINYQLKAARQLLPQISKINNKIEIDYWLKKMSQKIAIAEDILREELAKILKNTGGFKAREVENLGSEKKEFLPKDLQLFRQLLAIVLKYPPLLPKIIDGLKTEYLSNQITLDLYKRLVFFYTESVGLKPYLFGDNLSIDLYGLISDFLKDDKAGSSPLGEENNSDSQELIGLLNESFLLANKDFGELSEREARSELETILRILNNDYLNKKINLLNQELKEAETQDDRERTLNLSWELAELLKKKEW